MKVAVLSILFSILLGIGCEPFSVGSDSNLFNTLIVGGDQQDISDRNFQVALILPPPAFLCGGSLFKDNWVITAAHCTIIFDTYDITVRAGSNNYDYGGETRSVSQILNHKEYNSANVDVSLLKLSSRFHLSATIGLISLARSIPPLGSAVIVSGYGRSSYMGPSTPYLESVVVNIISKTTCRDQYGREYQSHMICASAPGKDSCSGDSGGPLTYNGELIGIVSFGRECAHPLFAGVYTSVPVVADWIIRNAV